MVLSPPAKRDVRNWIQFDSDSFLQGAVFVFPCYLLERKYIMAKKEYGTRKHYHFIYKTTNLLSGKYYIGMHSTDDLEDGYLGSGTYLKRSINKHGKENHLIEILEFVDSRKELAAREKEIVSLQEIAKKECMNLKVGGNGGFSKELQSKGASLAGKKHSERMKNEKEYREQVLIKMSIGLKKAYETGKKQKNYTGWMAGRKMTPETISKMKEVKVGHGKGVENSQFGKCWITNETENRKIYKGDTIPEGWRLGRILNIN